MILKIQQRFKSERHNIFAEVIYKINLSSNDDKKCSQLIQQKHMHVKRVKI